MKIVIAPNAFKNAITAMEAADAIRRGIEQSGLEAECIIFPVADGGDGTMELLNDRLGGQTFYSDAHGPVGEKLRAPAAWVEAGHIALIEMASASGIRLLAKNELDPFKATTYGTGEQIRAALDHGAQKILIGVGGSATVDGGCGLIRALGGRYLNASGEELTDLPRLLTELAAVDTSLLDARVRETDITILCDVENPLLGRNGAASVFGPQKGASPDGIRLLEKGLSRLASVVAIQTHHHIAELRHGGAAGGAAAGMFAFLNAKLTSGIDYFLSATNFAEIVNGADLVITGEGSLDDQTLNGKGPFGVASLAKRFGIQVIGLAGVIPYPDNARLKSFFDELICINKNSLPLPEAIRNTSANLAAAGKELGERLKATPNHRSAPGR